MATSLRASNAVALFIATAVASDLSEIMFDKILQNYAIKASEPP
jgi:hypothetical protein